MSTGNCYRCGLPQFFGGVGYAGLQCKCWTFYRPAPDAAPPAGCTPAPWLTEADVRRIVREELARAAKAAEGGE